MTPDKMRDRIKTASEKELPQEGLRTLWIATSEGTQQRSRDTIDRVLSVTPQITSEEFHAYYVDAMLEQHRAHIFAGSERSVSNKGRVILLIDIITSNRRQPWYAEIDEEGKILGLKFAREGVFDEKNVPRYQEIIRHNVMINEGVA